MNFSLLEKLAIVKALDEMILADEVDDPKEREFLSKVVEDLDINTAFINESRYLKNTECFDILKRMSSDKKAAFEVMLRDMVEADGQVESSEVNLLISILEQIGLNEKDDQLVLNVPDLNYIHFVSSAQFRYDQGYSSDRKSDGIPGNVKIESLPGDGRNFLVTIFKQDVNYGLWGVDTIYPSREMKLCSIQDDMIVLESSKATERLEMFYKGVDIESIRFSDKAAGIYIEFVR